MIALILLRKKSEKLRYKIILWLAVLQQLCISTDHHAAVKANGTPVRL